VRLMEILRDWKMEILTVMCSGRSLATHLDWQRECCSVRPMNILGDLKMEVLVAMRWDPSMANHLDWQIDNSLSLFIPVCTHQEVTQAAAA
jgi:hypothetical protein